jgi:hypothetical protein
MVTRVLNKLLPFLFDINTLVIKVYTTNTNRFCNGILAVFATHNPRVGMKHYTTVYPQYNNGTCGKRSSM